MSQCSSTVIEGVIRGRAGVFRDEGGGLAWQMTEHEGLVRWVVRRQWLGELPFADALHEGRIGLWRALLGFDRARGTAFSTYAVVAIQRSVWRAVEERGRVDSAEGETSVSSRPAPPPPIEWADFLELLHRRQVRSEVRQLVAQLPPRLRRVVVAHYGLDNRAPQTFAAIGRSLGVSRQRVQQLHVDALLWLAQPAHSLALRSLVERQSRADYQQAMARQRRIARARRGYRRGSRRSAK